MSKPPMSGGRHGALAALEHVADRLDVRRVRVVAEQVAHVVGARADQRDGPTSGRSGSVPSLRRSTRLLRAIVARELACDVGVARRGRLRRVDERLLEEAERELRPQHAAHGDVERLRRDEARRRTASSSGSP